MEKSPEAFRTISEVADSIDLPQHVLRFWETRFPQIRPLKRAGGRRYYRPEDVERLRLIKRLLYDEGYTIKGVQKLFKEQGVQALTSPPVEPRFASPVAEPTPDDRAGLDLERGPGQSIVSVNPAPPAVVRRDVGVAELAALKGALADVAEAVRILRQARARES
jgi:DNA-binding transcriptional MerR regulator